MLSIITSYLVQTGECALPHIGFFTTEYIPATNDIVNKQILPPAEEIIFSAEVAPAIHELVKYIALRKDINEDDATMQLESFCKHWKEKIDAGETLCFETFGCLKKGEGNVVEFLKEDSHAFYTAVPANKVIHLNAEHQVLVGDKQTTSAEMNKYYTEESVTEKKSWRIGAVVLFAIVLVMLFYSFYSRKFSSSSVGNRSHINVYPAGETHVDVSK